MNRDFITGVNKAIPVVLGYIPIGLAFGILANHQGLSTFEIFLMSFMVYAGASQFIASAMIASGVSPASIILTTLLINMRHMLMSASLSTYLKHIPSSLQAILSFGLTDETYAVDITHCQKHKSSAAFFLGLHAVAHAAWVISTLAGGILGNLISDPTRWGIDFALSAMFIALLCIHMKEKMDILVAIYSGALSILLTMTLGNGWNIILATMLAATIGVSINLWNRKFYLSS
ncbi:MAG: AzlC family ABC transporter permease [Clostridiales bacterium]|jgi:4-azaleucine resistance transporter AzlC|nr:AzlC family ABC transporter permease [Clostridiales bacterium]